MACPVKERLTYWCEFSGGLQRWRGAGTYGEGEEAEKNGFVQPKVEKALGGPYRYL